MRYADRERKSGTRGERPMHYYAPLITVMRIKCAGQPQTGWGEGGGR